MKDADSEEMPVGSPLADHEFVSDSYQTGNINADELKKEMDQLGMSDKMQDSSGTGLYLYKFCMVMLIALICMLNCMNQVLMYLGLVVCIFALCTHCCTVKMKLVIGLKTSICER